jgi:hypothetical protein
MGMIVIVAAICTIVLRSFLGPAEDQYQLAQRKGEALRRSIEGWLDRAREGEGWERNIALRNVRNQALKLPSLYVDRDILLWRVAQQLLGYGRPSMAHDVADLIKMDKWRQTAFQAIREHHVK